MADWRKAYARRRRRSKNRRRCSTRFRAMIDRGQQAVAVDANAKCLAVGARWPPGRTSVHDAARFDVGRPVGPPYAEELRPDISPWSRSRLQKGAANVDFLRGDANSPRSVLAMARAWLGVSIDSASPSTPHDGVSSMACGTGWAFRSCTMRLDAVASPASTSPLAVRMDADAKRAHETFAGIETHAPARCIVATTVRAFRRASSVSAITTASAGSHNAPGHLQQIERNIRGASSRRGLRERRLVSRS